MTLSKWSRRGRFLAAPLALGIVTAIPQLAQAEDSSAAPDVEELQREVERLQKRVEILEQQPETAAPPEATTSPEKEPENEPAPGAPAPLPSDVGTVEATEEEVERALERALVQTGALLLPTGTGEVRHSFSYVRQSAEVPVILVGDDGQQLFAESDVRRDIFAAGLILRLGLPLASQVDVDLPYRYKDQSTVTPFAARQEVSRYASGLGDVGVTLATTLLRERGWRPDLIARVRWDSDSGEKDDGLFLGSGFHELSGSLTAVRRLDPLVFVGGVSYEESYKKGGGDPGDEIGFSLGTLLAASPETSLRFFLDQTFVDEIEIHGVETPGSDQVLATFSVGASVILNARMLLDVTAGIGLTDATSDYFVSVAIPIRF